LSGVAAVFGTIWRDGVILAVEEVNARGGILGHKIEMSHLDTQSDAGISRAQVSKVLENDPYAVLGPVSSGSVDMMLTQQAEVPHIRNHAEESSLRVSYIVRPAIQHAENR
jgi:branched-chain amino acid transport system substrate-binding protein